MCGVSRLLSAQELAKTPSALRFCRKALALQKRLFRLWHRFRGDPHGRGAPLTREQLITRVLPIEKQWFALAGRHINAANDDVRNLAPALFLHLPHCFTFVDRGRCRADDELAVARLLTITRTCQVQQLNALVYLTAAIRAHRRRQVVASLLSKAATT